jgi:hypothetical protein
MKDQAFRLYRFASLAMAVAFAAVGLVFLFLPARVLALFNRFSAPLGLPAAPLQAGSFYPLLGVAYMYLVTLLAGLMFEKPGNRLLPLLLAQAKLASAVLSLVFFFGHSPYLVCLANAIVDGCLGALVLRLYFLQKKSGGSWPT